MLRERKKNPDAYFERFHRDKVPTFEEMLRNSSFDLRCPTSARESKEKLKVQPGKSLASGTKQASHKKSHPEISGHIRVDRSPFKGQGGTGGGQNISSFDEKASNILISRESSIMVDNKDEMLQELLNLKETETLPKEGGEGGRASLTSITDSLAVEKSASTFENSEARPIQAMILNEANAGLIVEEKTELPEEARENKKEEENLLIAENVTLEAEKLVIDTPQQQESENKDTLQLAKAETHQENQMNNQTADAQDIPPMKSNNDGDKILEEKSVEERKELTYLETLEVKIGNIFEKAKVKFEKYFCSLLFCLLFRTVSK